MVSSKAQIYSTDLFVGVTIFLLVLTSFLILWSTGINRLTYFEKERWRDETARVIAEQLVESPGYPTHWEQISILTETNLRTIGLTKERNVLNMDKIQKLLHLDDDQNYTFIKRVLGAGKYDFCVNVSSLDGTNLYSYGRAPTSDSVVSVVSRLAILDDNIVVVNVYVWE